jgi:hypothetical protein
MNSRKWPTFVSEASARHRRRANGSVLGVDMSTCRGLILRFLIGSISTSVALPVLTG